MVRSTLMALLLAVAAIPASATVITRDVELDLDNLGLPSSQIFTLFSLDAPVTVNAGDTLELNLTFARGESLLVTDVGGDSPREVFDFTFGTAGSGDTINLTTTFDFVGVTGNLFDNGLVVSTSAAPRIGTFTFSDLTDTNFGFEGLSLSVFSESGNDSFIVDEISLLATINLFGQGTTGPNAFTRASSVSEPPAILLMLSLMLLACRSRLSH